MKNAKLLYFSPTVDVYVIELEESIAAGSATLSGGRNAGAPYVPGVEDWAPDEEAGSTIGEF